MPILGKDKIEKKWGNGSGLLAHCQGSVGFMFIPTSVWLFNRFLVLHCIKMLVPLNMSIGDVRKTTVSNETAFNTSIHVVTGARTAYPLSPQLQAGDKYIGFDLTKVQGLKNSDTVLKKINTFRPQFSKDICEAGEASVYPLGRQPGCAIPVL
ncbi:hypothetical protein C8J56DRAFT_1109677 [Mycena floridula]|nr:hypothetical protein C8J56DRAFT_1109677 [Mycena floridula]